MTSTVHTRTSTQKHTREGWAGDAGGAAIRMVWGEGKVVSTGGVGGGGRGGGAWLCCGGGRTAAGVREVGEDSGTTGRDGRLRGGTAGLRAAGGRAGGAAVRAAERCQGRDSWAGVGGGVAAVA